MKTNFIELTTEQHKIVYAITAGFFAKMLNPRSQGTNFTWDKFPDMAKNYVESHMIMYQEISRNDQKLCGDMAFYISTEWLKSANLLNN